MVLSENLRFKKTRSAREGLTGSASGSARQGYLSENPAVVKRTDDREGESANRQTGSRVSFNLRFQPAVGTHWYTARYICIPKGIQRRLV